MITEKLTEAYAFHVSESGRIPKRIILSRNDFDLLRQENRDSVYNGKIFGLDVVFSDPGTQIVFGD